MDHHALKTINMPLAIIAPALQSAEGRDLRTWGALQLVIGPAGTGRLTRPDAVRGLMELGLQKSAANTWLNDLVKSRFATLGTRRRTGVAVVVLTAISRVHADYRVVDRGHMIAVPLTPLILGRGYKRLLALAAASAVNDRPISRASKQKLFCVSASTQRRGERQFGAVVEQNVIAHKVVSSDDPRAITVDRMKYFKNNGVVYERRPNSTRVPFTLTRRSQRRNSATPIATAEPTSVKPSRQYYPTDRAVRERIRRYGMYPSAGRKTAKRDDQRLFVLQDRVTIQGKLVITWKIIEMGLL